MELNVGPISGEDTSIGLPAERGSLRLFVL
jgi:hypothetical protein